MKSWNERAKESIAQGCLTYSKRADQFIEGVYPTHAIDGDGCRMLTPMPLVDYVCGLGSNLIDIQNNYSLPSIFEVELAERVKGLFPCIDRLKFLKTGSDACSAAIRIARAFTGGKWVLGSGYHGWHDAFISAEDPGCGTLKGDQYYEKAASLDQVIEYLNDGRIIRYAAVIIEPVQLDMNVRPQLEVIRRLCSEKGIVLIFDEVITGFRFLDYSVANHFGIQPDLICLGKALGNGYPISIVGGREDIMETPGYFISTTFAGEAHGLTQALDTLDFLTEEKIEALWERGERFQREFNELSPQLQLVGYGTRAELQGDDRLKSLFMQEMVKRGYFFGRAFFITHAHTKHILSQTLKEARSVMESIDRGEVQLEGQMPRPVFRRN